MRISKKSIISGKVRTREIAVTSAQLAAWRNGALIQTCMPLLSNDDREFLINGITPEEWDETFSSPEPLKDTMHRRVHDANESYDVTLDD